MRVKVDDGLKRVKSVFTKPQDKLKRVRKLYEKKEDTWKLRWEFIPRGTIVMYDGSIENIPLGWSFCDGTNGTPDLRGLFIKAAINNEEIGLTGGEEDHRHTITSGGAHSHSVGTTGSAHSHGGYIDHFFGDVSFYYSGSDNSDFRGSILPHSHSATSSAHTHTVSIESVEPVNYKLAFIMRI